MTRLIFVCLLLAGCFSSTENDPIGECYVWGSETPSDGLGPFVARDLLWEGREDPYVSAEGLTVEDRAALFIRSGYWRRTLITFKITIPQIPYETPTDCRRFGWLVGDRYFVSGRDGNNVSGSDIQWSSEETYTVEIEEVCDPYTNVGYKERRIDGVVFEREERNGCVPLLMVGFGFTPGFLMECETYDPVEPAGMVPGLWLDVESFCFESEGWEDERWFSPAPDDPGSAVQTIPPLEA